MSTLEIIGGAALLVICLAIVVICLMQDQKSQDSMTAALTGASTDSFYGKNEGRTKEAKLNKVTRALGIILFVIVLAVNLIPLFTSTNA
jgi:preprotein translocase subunit SecG